MSGYGTIRFQYICRRCLNLIALAYICLNEFHLMYIRYLYHFKIPWCCNFARFTQENVDVAYSNVTHCLPFYLRLQGGVATATSKWIINVMQWLECIHNYIFAANCLSVVDLNMIILPRSLYRVHFQVAVCSPFTKSCSFYSTRTKYFNLVLSFCQTILSSCKSINILLKTLLVLNSKGINNRKRLYIMACAFAMYAVSL